MTTTPVQMTHQIARAPACAQTKATPPTKTHEIARAHARAQTTVTNGRSETEGAHPVRQHSTEVLCTHWSPAPTALHLRMQWRGLLSRVRTSSGVGGGVGGLEATRIRTKVQATTTQRGAEGARRKRRSSKTTSLRNHEELRRAVFEHRHHRKAPAALAGP